MTQRKSQESLHTKLTGPTRRSRRLSVAAVILIGLALTFSAYSLVRTWEHDVIDSEFERRANNHSAVLQATIDQHVELLESLAGLYIASKNVERSEFRRFVDPILARNSEVQAYGWNPLVRYGERGAFEAAARQEGLSDFRITELDESGNKIPAQRRDEYVAVHYLEPLSGNEQALGYDIASEDTRREALVEARESGQAVTTKWIRLVQEKEDQYGVLIVRPVYAEDEALESAQRRHDALKGYVVGVFRIGDMIEEALRPADPVGLDFWVYQAAQPDFPAMNYFHPSRSRVAEDTHPRFSVSDPHHNRHLHLALKLPGKQWSIVYKPAPAFLAAHSQHAATGVLLSGLALTTLVGFYLFSVQRESERTAILNHRLANSNNDLQREIIEREEAENALRESESYNRMLFEESTIGLALWDIDGNLVDANPAFASIVGRTVEETKQLRYWEITPEKLSDDEQTKRDSLGQDGRHGTDEKEYIHKDGHLVPVRQTGRILMKGDRKYIWSSVEDITDYKQARDRIDHMAFHDALTNLPNRKLLRDRLDHAISLAHRSKTFVGVMFLDIDRFKTINDSLGHSVGDQLLKKIADRLKSTVREADTVARFGGDEFVVIAEGISGSLQLEMLAKVIIERVTEPFRVGANELYVTTSIGVALASGEATNVDSLIAQADVAMYSAKGSGRNNYQFHSPDMGQRVSQRAAIESDLRGALEREELLFHLQPIMNLETGLPIGMEALMRWKHPKRGLISPAEFIPVMEDSGMIMPASRWILKQSCEYLRDIRREAQQELSLAVNFSAPCFYDKGIADYVKHTLSDSDIEPQRLILEITESTLFEDPQRVRPVLEDLKTMGIRIALDDFGTGQSSLSHLRSFPIDIVKIDREFIRDIPKNKNDCELVSAIIAMACNLNMCVVAEGVEQDAQLAFLRERGCDRVQGYYFSPPIPGEEMLTYLLEAPKLRAVADSS